VRLFKHGLWETIVVDDRMPCRANRPIYVRSKTGNELWMMLLEKASALHAA
jgi:hypothetical protein